MLYAEFWEQRAPRDHDRHGRQQTPSWRMRNATVGWMRSARWKWTPRRDFLGLICRGNVRREEERTEFTPEGGVVCKHYFPKKLLSELAVLSKDCVRSSRGEKENFSMKQTLLHTNLNISLTALLCPHQLTSRDPLTCTLQVSPQVQQMACVRAVSQDQDIV